jgi:hypothetical protein
VHQQYDVVATDASKYTVSFAIIILLAIVLAGLILYFKLGLNGKILR